MNSTALQDRYSRAAVVLHWLVAVLIVANVALALSADYLPDDAVRPVIDTHKSIGITVLGLMLLRLLWRLGHKPPAFAEHYPRWQKRAAHLVHGLLYVLALAMPLSGWIHDSAWKDAATHPMHWFGLFEWPRIGYFMTLAPATRESMHDLFGDIHTWLAYVLYALLALHIGAALKHQWLDREPELRRMWF